MSGGRYNYAYRHLEDFADDLRTDFSADDGYCDYEGQSLLRMRFAAHCRVVARAMRACEWNDSADGDSEEQALIHQVLSGVLNRGIT